MEKGSVDSKYIYLDGIELENDNINPSSYGVDDSGQSGDGFKNFLMTLTRDENSSGGDGRITIILPIHLHTFSSLLHLQ